MAANLGSRHAKTLERIFTNLSASCNKRIDELNENCLEQKEWLRTTLATTKEKKYCFVSLIQTNICLSMLMQGCTGAYQPSNCKNSEKNGVENGRSKNPILIDHNSMPT